MQGLGGSAGFLLATLALKEHLMALGNVTSVAAGGVMPSAPTFFDVISFALDNSYVTGGYTGLQAKVKAKTAVNRDVSILAFIPQDCNGYIPVWDPTNSKLKVYYIDNNNGSDGPMIEVPNATDLSAVTVKGLLISR